MRVLVCGGRKFYNKKVVFGFLDALEGVTHIIHGAASGADTMGELWGKRKEGVEVIPFPALWDDVDNPSAYVKYTRYGKPYNANAGFERNERMLSEGKPDLIVAFPGGRGTADMIARGKAGGIEVIQLEEK